MVAFGAVPLSASMSLGLTKYKLIQRKRAQAVAEASALAAARLAMDILAGDPEALAVVKAAAAPRDQSSAEPIRKVERARGKWRGSTLSGYLRGDDKTYVFNFRCTKRRLGELAKLLEGSQFDPAVALAKTPARLRAAQAALDHPTLTYKVATCMYSLGHGGPVKVLADSASIGKTTLLSWLGEFCEAVIKVLKPLYMPGRPMTAKDLAAVKGQFASRRGMQDIALACDGSHVPFCPASRFIASDYRNYKGWYSILAVAFVDSYYRFFEVDVGYPGRAGDNTVLAQNLTMKAIREEPDKWLGKNGLILGDSGASDGDTLFLNPFFNAAEESRCWFNFCHSSTRFFVEQTFGMWKSRFRFLINRMPNTNHELNTKMIYASTILHNYLVTHKDDMVPLPLDQNDPQWATFYKYFESHMCPSCKYAQKVHCSHQAQYRNGLSHTRGSRVAPSVVREVIREKMWDDIGDCDYRAIIMASRASNGIGE